jgi:hypothetical protein
LLKDNQKAVLTSEDLPEKYSQSIALLFKKHSLNSYFAVAILAILYILQNNAYIFPGQPEFSATQESLPEPLVSSYNHTPEKLWAYL